MQRSLVNAFAGFIFALVVGTGVAIPRIGHAETVTQADEQTFRAMISGQIAAFQHDDGATAYGFASPAIRDLFPSVERFMAMVRNGYPPVYRPRSVTFGAVSQSRNGPQQKVFITGPHGRNWVAIYTMQRQADGTWKINGCMLVEDDGLSV